MTQKITSKANPLVREIIKLRTREAERKRTGLFVAEGRREVSLALSSGIPVHKLLICPDYYLPEPLYPVRTELVDSANSFILSPAVYVSLAYRNGAEGVMIIGKQKDHRPGSFSLPPDPLILLLEGTEKPGNLGAVMRTADAAGVDALVIAGARTGIYNPNTIRSSLGCVFTLPVISCSSQEAVEWLQDQSMWEAGRPPKLILASLQAEKDYFEEDMTGACVLAFGAEASGLSKQWAGTGANAVRIPMAGAIDSLNLSASAAIMTFEAVRQRQLKASGVLRSPF